MLIHAYTDAYIYLFFLPYAHICLYKYIHIYLYSNLSLYLCLHNMLKYACTYAYLYFINWCCCSTVKTRELILVCLYIFSYISWQQNIDKRILYDTSMLNEVEVVLDNVKILLTTNYTHIDETFSMPASYASNLIRENFSVKPDSEKHP